MIKIIKGNRPEDGLPSVEVHSYPSPNDRFVVISVVTAFEEEGNAVVIRKLIDRERMSFEEAVEVATRFAKGAELNRIFVRNDTR